MVEVIVRQIDDLWIGLAMDGPDYVATVVESSHEAATHELASCLPTHLETTAGEPPAQRLISAVEMVARLEYGDESEKTYSLSKAHLTGPAYRIYGAAAQIPKGYITTYGALARSAHSEARAVGRAMATNPLYPIVPCHRVIGSDFSMVGYGGRQDTDALTNKYTRLEAEVSDHPEEHYLEIDGTYLPLYPVEWALDASREADARLAWRRHGVELEQAEARAQLTLF